MENVELLLLLLLFAFCLYKFLLSLHPSRRKKSKEIISRCSLLSLSSSMDLLTVCFCFLVFFSYCSTFLTFEFSLFHSQWSCLLLSLSCLSLSYPYCHVYIKETCTHLNINKNTTSFLSFAWQGWTCSRDHYREWTNPLVLKDTFNSAVCSSQHARSITQAN